MTVTVFGIRHHGPGSARSLVAALTASTPDIILVEGPPEGDPLLAHAADRELQPPVALLIYRPDMPRRAAFFPFAVFSPEWQAIQFALGHSIPIRFCDLPQSIQLAADPEAETAAPVEETAGEPGSLADRILGDPLGVLAEAAGYEDLELWWEEQVERRADPKGLFEGIMEAMRALRAEVEVRDEREARREAHMRQVIRRAEKDGFGRIAVVCGAWHAPALDDRASAKHDTALLTGLKRVRVDTTWIPWSNFRLSYRSGYGAGIVSPGWYGHLWGDPESATVGWIARSAHLLRGEGLDAPASSVIDAVRLGDTLAALRDRPHPGLRELSESIQTVLCAGHAAPMQLIRRKLEVGDVVGTVPESVARVPVQLDLEREQRRLRLRPDDAARTLDLDLRRDLDRDRSALLHRLRLLNIPWGVLEQQRAIPARSNRRGTFHELWRLQWQVEFVLLVIERNIWGNTLLDATEAFVEHEAESADLPRLTELLHGATVAGLSGAIAGLLRRVQETAAVATDVHLLLAAFPPLAQVARYGDVRGTAAEQVMPIVEALFERALIGLPGACMSLDDDTADGMVSDMSRVDEGLRLLDAPEMGRAWQALLLRLTGLENVHMLVRGWCCRRALDQQSIDDVELARLARIALSPTGAAVEASAWLQGLLRGSGLALLHQDGLWMALDGWLQRLDAETFTATLPLVRRAFSGFQAPERRAMGEKVTWLRDRGTDQIEMEEAAGGPPINRERARLVLPVLAHILGGLPDGN